MKSPCKKEISFTLVLNKEEAEWLKYQMQNPINVENHAHEDPVDAINRKAIWYALTPPVEAPGNSLVFTSINPYDNYLET